MQKKVKKLANDKGSVEAKKCGFREKARKRESEKARKRESEKARKLTKSIGDINS